VRIEIHCAKTPVDEGVVIVEERHAEDGRVALEVDNSKNAPLMDGFVVQLEGDMSGDCDFVLGFAGECCLDWCAFLERDVVVLEEGGRYEISGCTAIDENFGGDVVELCREGDGWLERLVRMGGGVARDR
jgi:hypothetical protein